MSSEEGGSSAVFECQIEQRLEHHKDLFNANNDSNGNCSQDNGEGDANPCYIDARDELLQTAMEHKFQNEYFKSQFESLKLFCQDPAGYYQQSEAIGEDDRTSEEVKSLHEKLESVGRELSEEKQTGIAAEEALKHLRALYSEADAKAQELSAKLAEAQQRMDQEIKDRDEKYSDLDSKFSRLHKRAKQRIQDIQKEKDELEARLQNLNEAAEQASLQQSAMQQELERTRHHANEALKAMDVERQQLRSANNKFRDNIEELGRSLEDKKNTLEALHQSLLEKEQVLEDMRESLKAADEKRQTSLAELSAKHQKQVVSLEAQLADALSDRNKATETISSLQVLLADKESQIAEIDAASTGEVARLMASMETIKRELIHFKQEHEKEKEGWEAASHSLKAKLEAADSNRIHAELEAAKMRSQLEYGESLQSRLINSKEAELIAAKEEINRLEREFLSYKARAHALLQKKDAEVAAAKESDQLKALEEEIKEAEKEIISISTERDVAFQELQVVLAKHSEQLAARDADLSSAKQQIIDIGLKLDSTKARHQSEKEAWEINLQNLEETWRIKFEALKAQAEASSDEDLKKEVKELKTQYKILKEEHESFHDLADRMIEEKDNEITKLLDDNDSLRRSLDLRPQADHYDNYITGPQKLDASNSNTSVAEQQILLLARQQAQREEELAQSQRHILALQEEIEELERENRLHSQQEAMLKDELRSMERMQKREGIDMTYLKNVILKLLETGEVEALLPVIGMLLQFSPEELRKCQLAYQSAIDVLPSQTTDESGSALSLFSRFSFS